MSTTTTTQEKKMNATKHGKAVKELFKKVGGIKLTPQIQVSEFYTDEEWKVMSAERSIMLIFWLLAIKKYCPPKALLSKDWLEDIDGYIDGYIDTVYGRIESKFLLDHITRAQSRLIEETFPRLRDDCCYTPKMEATILRVWENMDKLGYDFIGTFCDLKGCYE